MKSSHQIDELIAQESAQWTEVLKRGDAHDKAAFAKWSLKSPQHMRHFMMMVALDRELELLDPARQLDIAETHEGNSRTVVLLSEHVDEKPRERFPATRKYAIAAAVAGVVTVLALVRFTGTHNANEFSTARGEQRAVELTDGSIMHLNTQSSVQVRFSKEGRDIDLAAGEALFKVAKEPSRPFRVHAAGVVIQAVGTQFNVYAQPHGAKISVLEGRVNITADRLESLGAGEEVQIDDRGRIGAHDTAEVTTLAAWRQRRLVFDRRPLLEVVTEFNRYNSKPRFRVDSEVAQRPYSGAFDADDPESLVQLLSLDAGLELVTSETEILIQKR